MTEEELVLQIFGHYNGSFFHVDEIIQLVKQIDRRFTGLSIRKAISTLIAEGVIQIVTGKSPRYGVWDEGRPIKLHNTAGIRGPRAYRQFAPHEDIIPMEGWWEE